MERKRQSDKVDLRRAGINELRRAGRRDVEIAEDYGLDARSLRRIAGPRREAIRALVSEPEPLAANAPTESTPSPDEPERAATRAGSRRRRSAPGGRILRLDPEDALGRDYRPGDVREDGKVLVSSARIGVALTQPDGRTEYSAVNDYWREQDLARARVRRTVYADGSYEDEEI